MACGAPSDQYGDHSVGCGFQRKRNTCHNSFTDVLYQTAQQAVLSPWREGHDMALDVTVISLLDVTALTLPLMSTVSAAPSPPQSFALSPCSCLNWMGFVHLVK